LNKASLILPDWPAPQNVKAFTTCRTGGYSGAPFDSLNVAQHVGDEVATVEKNRQLLPNHEKFVWLNQTHSNICINLDKKENREKGTPQGDACFSESKEQVCAVMTADCLPILLCDQQGTCVAAVHAGWRGLADGVIENTVSSMPVEPKNLLAWMGPAIGPNHFEVGIDVKQSFSDYPGAFRKNIHSDEDKYFADLYTIAKRKLSDVGVTQLFGGQYCTYAQESLFFSHRRATHQKNVNQSLPITTGRMVNAIYLL
jgi:YfiH family protein